MIEKTKISFVGVVPWDLGSVSVMSYSVPYYGNMPDSENDSFDTISSVSPFGIAPLHGAWINIPTSGSDLSLHTTGNNIASNNARIGVYCDFGELGPVVQRRSIKLKVSGPEAAVEGLLSVGLTQIRRACVSVGRANPNAVQLKPPGKSDTFTYDADSLTHLDEIKRRLVEKLRDLEYEPDPVEITRRGNSGASYAVIAVQHTAVHGERAVVEESSVFLDLATKKIYSEKKVLELQRVFMDQVKAVDDMILDSIGKPMSYSDYDVLSKAIGNISNDGPFEDMTPIETWKRRSYKLLGEIYVNQDALSEEHGPAYAEYLASVGPEGTPMTFDEWLKSRLPSREGVDSTNIGSWWEKAYDMLKPLGSSALEFAKENPWMTAGLVGTTTGTLPKWVVPAGLVLAGVALLN